ncbi:MAG: IS66 family transposase [bacterium]|nr:MAG: IS66 family transposase [bacterium]
MPVTDKTIKRNFSNHDWENTPDVIKKEFEKLETLVFKLVDENEQLRERLYKLEVTVNKNSSNSSKPPSSDNPYKKRYPSNNNKKAGKAGPKVGHKGHRQKLMESTDVILVYPDVCKCGCKEINNQKPFYTHQEIELPEIKMDVTHFILHEGDCADCGKKVKASVPKAHGTGYGPRLSALIGEIVGMQGNSRTTIQIFCQSFLKFDISLGAIQKVVDRVSEAILPHYQAIAKKVRQAIVNGIDETIWKQNGKLKYLWAMVNSAVAYFMMHQHRSKEAFLELIEDWKGILISDGYRLYQNWVNLRQTCLSHLIRDARSLAEHPKLEINKFGQKALEKLQQICSMAQNIPTEHEWQDFYSGFIDLIFENINRFSKDEAGQFARRLFREIDCLWTFLEVAGVEPTNNNTERALRFGVLWRKRSQGTRSDKGNRWVERILSLRQTARLNNLSSYDILVDAMNCYFNEQKSDISWIEYLSTILKY